MSAEEGKTSPVVGEVESKAEQDKKVMPPPEPQINKADIEKEQETKLRSKYPALGRPGGPSNFLQKRLSKGQRFFDSGDYNMARAKTGSTQTVPAAAIGTPLVPGTDIIPHPEPNAHKRQFFKQPHQ